MKYRLFALIMLSGAINLLAATEIALIIPERMMANEGYALAVKDLKSALNNNGFDVISYEWSDNLPAGDKIIIHPITPVLRGS